MKQNWDISGFYFQVGTLVGLKTFVNEFAAYDQLRSYGDDISERAK